jgi:hypothetical protein
MIRYASLLKRKQASVMAMKSMEPLIPKRSIQPNVCFKEKVGRHFLLALRGQWKGRWSLKSGLFSEEVLPY